jgi:ABC-type bacteriocin/lantibiotic exporter with double-glycine peptidase domain
LIFNLNLPKSDKDLIDALRKAQLGKMIDSGEINLDTRLEFGGGGLSGGQRQRIGIARALLNHPSILVLDEPTSALDSQTELEIVKLLQNLKSSATIILIAHRTSIMKIADEIWNLDNGILDFKGQFDELSVTKPQENSDEK